MTTDAPNHDPTATAPTAAGDGAAAAQTTAQANTEAGTEAGAAQERRGPDRRVNLAGPIPDDGERRQALRRKRPQLTAERFQKLIPGNAGMVAVGVAAGLLLADFARGILADLQGLLVQMLIALFLSFAMEPAVQYLHKRGMRRGFGTMLVFLGMLVFFVGFVAAMAPLIIDQVQNLVDNGPMLLDSLADQAQRLPGNVGDSVAEWLSEQQSELPNRLPNFAGSIASGAARAGSTVAGGFIQSLTIALVTFYLVADGPKLRRVLLRRLPAERQREFLKTWEIAIGKTGGYVYSRALTAIASAAFHFIAFTIIGVPYPAALGIFVGLVSSLIPVIGTYIAGALPIVIAVADDPIKALWVIVAIIVYQQIENLLVAPRITAKAMELHPAVAFLSVLIGGAMLGAVGALLALPAAAIATALVTATGERHEVIDHIHTRESPVRSVRLPER